MRKIILRSEAVGILNEYARDQYFSGRKLHIMFRRQYPKCPRCGKQSIAWGNMSNAICDKCGVEVEYVADVKPMTIYSIGNYDKWVTCLDEHCQKRHCLIENLMWFSIDEDEYFVM